MIHGLYHWPDTPATSCLSLTRLFGRLLVYHGELILLHLWGKMVSLIRLGGRAHHQCKVNSTSIEGACHIYRSLSMVGRIGKTLQSLIAISIARVTDAAMWIPKPAGFICMALLALSVHKVCTSPPPEASHVPLARGVQLDNRQDLSAFSRWWGLQIVAFWRTIPGHRSCIRAGQRQAQVLTMIAASCK